MNCTKRIVLAITIATSINSGAIADESTRVIQYHPFSQPTIYCPSGLMCEIRLAKGEKITNAWNGAAPLWAPSDGTAGDTPVFTVKPERGGLHTNLILTTDAGRDYHLMLVSYDYDPNNARANRLMPLYTRFAYDDETWQRVKVSRRAAATSKAPAPLTITQQMDAACATMPPDEQYGTDVDPRELRPQGLPSRGGRSVCHTLDATYIQMPIGGPSPTDVPALIEDVPDGTKRLVNYAYEPASRIFKVDDVATEYALTTGQGKREVHLRIQRQIAGSTGACAVPKGKG